jgi:hypothetical protein
VLSFSFLDFFSYCATKDTVAVLINVVTYETVSIYFFHYKSYLRCKVDILSAENNAQITALERVLSTARDKDVSPAGVFIIYIFADFL